MAQMSIHCICRAGCTHWCCQWVRTFAHRHLRSSSGPSSHASRLATKYSKQLTPTITPSVKKMTVHVYCTLCLTPAHRLSYYGLVSRSPLFFWFVFSITHRNGRVAFMFILNVSQRTKSKRNKQFFKLRCIWYPVHGNERFVMLVCC